MPKKCLKCGYVRSSIDTGNQNECPKCGILYEKFEASVRKKSPESVKLKIFMKKLKFFSFLGLMALAFAFAINLVVKKAQKVRGTPNDDENIVTEPVHKNKSAEVVGVYSDSAEIKNILKEVNELSSKYGINVSIEDLKPYYDKGINGISIFPLTTGNAEKYGFSLPKQSDMTDEEFYKKKHYKCKEHDKGSIHIDEPPKNNKGISECLSQTYTYGEEVSTSDSVILRAGYRKKWDALQWDEEAGLWTTYTSAQKRIAQRAMLEEKAQELWPIIKSYDRLKDLERSKKVLAQYEPQMNELKEKLQSFGKDKLAHYKKAKKYGQFNAEDQNINDVYRKIYSLKDKMKYAYINAHVGRLRELGFTEFMSKNDIALPD